MAEDNVEPLITECPNCQTRFRVTEGQLKMAAGRVRCGACLTVFKGMDYLRWDDEERYENEKEALSALDDVLDELTTDAESTDRSAEAELPNQDFMGDDAISVPDDPDGVWSEPEHQLYGGHEEPPHLGPEVLQRIRQRLSAEHQPAASADAEVEVLVDDTAGAKVATERSTGESFTFGPPPSNRRWWVTIASASAVAALIAQVLWHQFDTWSLDPDIRPVYVVVCNVLDCELPMLSDTDSVITKNLVVRSHPEVANALLVDAIIVNQASFVQPFPVLELEFTSLQHEVVAGRRFKPEEYLAGALAGATAMQPQTPIHLEFAIEDPGVDAVNFRLWSRALAER